MDLKEAVESERDFKFGNQGRWLYVHTSGVICYKNTVLPARFSEEEILRSWWIVKEEWYECNFNKYPNGVLCQVSNGSDVDTMRNLDIIIDYCNNDDKKFKSLYHEWRYAKPVPPEETPTIIGED